MVGVRVVDLGGSPAEIGFAHGRGLADEIAAHLRAWRAWLSERTADVDAFISELVDGDGHRTAAVAAAPALAEEIEGIAEGAGIASGEAWLLQLIDESWGRLAGAHAPGRDATDIVTGVGSDHDNAARLGTSLAVIMGARSWTGQTVDLEPFRVPFLTVLRVQPADAEPLMVVTTAGSIGKLGLSQRRFALATNPLPQVPAATDGVPVCVIARQSLAQPSLDAAVEVVRRGPHASGQHYLLCSNRQVVSTECSPAGIAQVMAGSQRAWHTAHPLVGYLPEADDAGSEARWEAARRALTHAGWDRPRTRSLLELEALWTCDTSGSASAARTCLAVIAEQASWPAQLWIAEQRGGPWTAIEWPEPPSARPLRLTRAAP